LVATRNPLDHPLANAILATVLANEAVNRCGPVMIAEIAQARGVKETDVICAWAQAWAALDLTPVFAVLDAHALKVPRETSIAVDRRSRALQKAVINGVLAMPERATREAGAFAELTALFSRPQAVRELVPALHSTLPLEGLPRPWYKPAKRSKQSTASPTSCLPAYRFRSGWHELAAVPASGYGLAPPGRHRRLEHVLMHAPASAAQEPLRDHALQALRRAQQRLLMRVLQRAPSQALSAQDPAVIMAALIDKLKVGRVLAMQPVNAISNMRCSTHGPCLKPRRRQPMPAPEER